MSQNIVTTWVDYSDKSARVWARNNGYFVAARGRLSADAVDAFIRAGSPEPVSLVKAKAPRIKRDPMTETVATILVRRACGKGHRKAVREVEVSREALRAVRGPGRGRPNSSAYLAAAEAAGTVTERDLIVGMRTTAGGHYTFVLPERDDDDQDDDQDDVRGSFRCVSKSDSAAAVAAHRAVVLA